MNVTTFDVWIHSRQTQASAESTDTYLIGYIDLDAVSVVDGVLIDLLETAYGREKQFVDAYVSRMYPNPLPNRSEPLDFTDASVIATTVESSQYESWESEETFRVELLNKSNTKITIGKNGVSVEKINMRESFDSTLIHDAVAEIEDANAKKDVVTEVNPRREFYHPSSNGVDLEETQQEFTHAVPSFIGETSEAINTYEPLIEKLNGELDDWRWNGVRVENDDTPGELGGRTNAIFFEFLGDVPCETVHDTHGFALIQGEQGDSQFYVQTKCVFTEHISADMVERDAEAMTEICDSGVQSKFVQAVDDGVRYASDLCADEAPKTCYRDVKTIIQMESGDTRSTVEWLLHSFESYLGMRAYQQFLQRAGYTGTGTVETEVRNALRSAFPSYSELLSATERDIHDINIANKHATRIWSTLTEFK